MSSTYSDLKFELIATGEQSGTWGDTTNTNIGTAIEQAIVGMATLATGDFTANVCTLTLSNTNALQDARALCLNITATLSGAGTVNVPAIEKPYIVINGSSYTVTVKVSGQTGVAVPAGKRTVVYNDGTDVGNQVSYLANLALGSALAATSGGTGQTSFTTGDLLYASNSTTVSKLGIGTEGQILEVSSGVPAWTTAAPTGVTDVTASLPLSSSGGTTPNITFLSPGTSGNVLTSNGSTWVSSAPAASGITAGQSIAFDLIFAI